MTLEVRRRRGREPDSPYVDTPAERVVDVMNRPSITIAPWARVADAEFIAADARVHHLLVVESGRLVGVVCAHDLHASDPEAAVFDVMSAPAIVVGPLLAIADAAELMRVHGVGCLPVIDGFDLVGIVTRGDLRRAGADVPEPPEPRCAACGSEHHVRLDPRTGSAAFCLDCLERARPPGADEDLGVGD